MNMFNRFFEKILSIWSINDGVVVNPKIIVPHGYGLCIDGSGEIKLPDPSIKTLCRAIEIAKNYPDAILVIPNSNYFWEGSEKNEESLKRKILEINEIRNEIVVLSILSTVDEVDKASSFIKNNIEPWEGVVAIFDSIHARSGCVIWKKFLPECRIAILSIDGEWESFMPSWFQRSKINWFLGNLARYILFFLFGEKIKNITHRVKFNN